MGHPDSSEQRRLDALRHLEVLNTPRERPFDDLARLAADLLSAPIALISLVAETHQWFKACIGLPIDGTSREVSFCAHAIAQDDLDAVFVVPDATADRRFHDNPLVTGSPHIRFYAGAPLVTRGGAAIGTLCVIDTVPRQATAAQLQTLKVLARSAVAQLELRRTAEDLRESEQRARQIVDTALDAVLTVDADLRVVDSNPRSAILFGRPGPELTGIPLGDLIAASVGGPAASGPFCRLFDPAPGDPAGRPVELSVLRADGTVLPAEACASPPWHSAGRRVFSLFVRDLSLRKREESERREAETRDVVIFALARLAESRDPETGAHIERVQHYCRALAEHLASVGMFPAIVDPEFVQLMYTTSPLHDIGKVGIPDDILLKPGRLNDREFEIMKSHAAIGAETLEAAMARFPNTRFLRMARNIAATHHERFDGGGYPRGLKGEDIPLCGRIAALADVYDALTSRRVYKAAFTHDVARGIIVKESGKQFDPLLVEAFLSIEARFQIIYRQFCEAADRVAA